MTPLRRRFFLFGIILLALAARIANLHGVFANGDVILFHTDSYYHLRRAWLTALYFPHVPSFDYFVNYPEGALIYWGPGLDWLIACAARVWAGGVPDLQTVSQVGAWTPVALGLLNVVLVYLAGREAFGDTAGLLAAGFFALSPLEAGVAAVGNVDHHVAEILFFTAALWLLLRALRSRRAWIPAWLSGLTFAMGLLFWPGATLAPSLLSFSAMAAVASCWARGGEIEREVDLLRALSLALGSAALIFAPFAFLGARSGLGAWSYYSASWFHETVLFLLMAATLLTSVIEGRRRPGGGIKIWRGAVWMTIALGAVGFLMLLTPDFRNMLAQGVSKYLFRRDPMTHAVLEMKPIGFWPMWRVLRDGTVLVLLAPALVAWALVASWRGRGADPRLGFVAWLGLGTLPLLVMEFYRYAPYHILPLALLAGWALAGASVPSVRWRRAAAGILFVLFIPTIFVVLRPTRSLNGHQDYGPVSEALEWMRHNTPPTRGLRDPAAKPEYGVLAHWDYGHWINVIGERANIANPFGLTPWHFRGVARSTSVLLEADPERAARMCERWRARYVLVTETIRYIEGLATILGRNPESYGCYPDHFSPKPPVFRALGTRLLFTDGGSAQNGSGRTLSPVERFRLVYESPYRFNWDVEARGNLPPGFQDRMIPAVKIYEVVAGALLAGRTRPFHPVTVEVGVRSNMGRTFVWRISRLSGPDGRFRFRVAYPTGGRWRLGIASSPEPYRVTCAHREVRVKVDESSVREGRMVKVDCGAEKRSSAAERPPESPG